MIPVVRVLAERAEARRGTLLTLAEVVPADYWRRRESDDAWPAHTHLAHALSADSLFARFLAGLIDITVEFEFDPEVLLVERQAAIDQATDMAFDELFELGRSGRTAVLRALGALTPGSLETTLVMRGASRWGQPASFTVYQYLEQWAGHDSGHEAAIRAAIATSPDLSAVAHVRRMR